MKIISTKTLVCHTPESTSTPPCNSWLQYWSETLGVKNVPEYLKWLNKNAPAVVTPIISSKMIYDNDKNIRSPR